MDSKYVIVDKGQTFSFENMRTPFATSIKASFWGVVTITAAVNGTTWKLYDKEILAIGCSVTK